MKLIMLDRDGVINHTSDNYIKSPDEWNAYPESIKAIARLNRKGYTVAVATNQSGIGRGLYSTEMLDIIHDKLHALLKVEGGTVSKLVYCPHTPDEGCNCRKPQPGLLIKLGKLLNTSIKGVPFVGDSITDLQAALSVGAAPVLVKTGKGESTIKQGNLPDSTEIYASLSDYVSTL